MAHGSNGSPVRGSAPGTPVIFRQTGLGVWYIADPSIRSRWTNGASFSEMPVFDDVGELNDWCAARGISPVLEAA